MPHVNNSGRHLIESYESCRLYAYDDATGARVNVGDAVKGTLTIGFGHTGSDVHPGETITQAEAEALFELDLGRFERGVNNLVTRNLTPNQFAACVSLAYNIGLGAFAESSVLRCINLGDFAGAQLAFAAWNKGTDATGALVVLDGLVRRRAAEAKLFGTP